MNFGSTFEKLGGTIIGCQSREGQKKTQRESRGKKFNLYFHFHPRNCSSCIIDKTRPTNCLINNKKLWRVISVRSIPAVFYPWRTLVARFTPDNFGVLTLPNGNKRRNTIKLEIFITFLESHLLSKEIKIIFFNRACVCERKWGLLFLYYKINIRFFAIFTLPGINQGGFSK